MTQRSSNTVKWIGFIVGTGLLIAGYVWNASAVCSQIKANQKEDDKMHPKIEQNEKDLLEMKKDIVYIREGIDELKRRNP